jgi:hypothetical protein
MVSLYRFPRWLALGVCLANAAALSGCATLRGLSGTKAGSSRLTVPDGPTAAQVGDAATPAEVSRFNARTSIPLPAGTRIEIPAHKASQTPAPAPIGAQPAAPASPAAVVTLSAASTLTTETTGQTARAQTTHAPAAPPTPAEIATGQGIRVFYWLAAGLALATVALFYLGHTKAAIVAAAGAASLPLLATSAAWIAMHAAVAIVCTVGALVAAWYFVRNRIPSP